MNLHLAEIAKAVAPGAHAVLLVDQAGWHLSAGLFIPANNQITAWKSQLEGSACEIFGSGGGTPAIPAIDVKSLHAKIGELTLENDF